MQGLIIIWGWFVLSAIMIACGIHYEGTMARAVLTVGILSGIAWIIFIFNIAIAIAMNSDI